MLKTDNALVPQSFQKETGPKPRALNEEPPLVLESATAGSCS